MTERLSDRLSGAGPRAGYAELQAMSNFTFLDGASHPDELVIAARALGLSALAITDRNSMAGLVRGHVAAREQGLRFLPGVRLDLVDGVSLLAWPRSRAGYGALTRLVSTGQRRVGKGGCRLGLDDLYGAHADAVFALVAPPGLPAMAALTACAAAIRHHLDRPLYLAAAHAHDGRDRRRLAMLDRVATDAGTPLLATGDVRYHSPARRPLADVLTCIRLGHTLATAGTRLDRHGERHLKSAAEMARLFADVPDAVARTLDVAEACTFSLDQLRYDYPDEPVPEGESAQSHLEALTWDGARHRFPAGVPAAVARTIARELALIGELDYAPYFLTVHDIVRFARSRGILCQGRGSAANSVVCYCLAITSVNPVEVDLLFERFISAARNEPPDIDVDFEHERREEVIQYIYARYGRERAALAATVIRYRPRSAVRDVGKVFGLGEDVTAALAGTVWGSWGAGVEPARVREAGLDPDEPTIARTLALSEQLLGFPRHLSQHVGGFVLTRSRLDEIVPVGNAAMADRTVIEWDKDDLDALGLLKIDVLALGMLTCIRKAFDLMRAHGRADLSLSAVPREDRAVYAMLARADSLGVFQVESRAQMAMLPRLRPRTFYDLVIEVAIVRPGPIQGDMVHPYLRRRNGEEAVVYPSPDPAHGPADELESVLGKTLGVPLFQEQAMRIAMVAAGFSGAEADRLRRAMATFRKVGTIAEFQHKMVPGMAARGYDPAFAERCFKQIEGFGEYGFPESHAASFALLVYVSAWLKCHEPAVFCASLLNSQPMGFYAPAQIVRDARDHGVAVRPVDALASHWDCTLEADPRSRGGLAVRLGLRLVKGLDRAAAARLVVEREGLVAAPGAGPLRRGGSAQTAAQTARTARA
ncbi:error-prone DNA polymerase, partial [Rhodothalassium salexigens]|uniref:error-prone DNA polymerase n=1 Tax=Rhodothalassium salexigens TaxID=1086 RepID=UPI0019117510